jgi:hemerythrin
MKEQNMTLWKESYATGNELVDNDHKEIFIMVEDVLASSMLPNKNKNEAAINFLAEYVVKHFAREEALMAESDYPGTAAHTQEHRDFVKVATEIIEDFESGGYALGELDAHPETIHLSKCINEVVINWLVSHVMGSDKDLATHYRNWKSSTQ